MRISLIAALSRNHVIGKDNDLIWHLPVDMKFFKEKTLGHHILMGRKNFESIPPKYRPLSGRTNMVVTRNENFSAAEIKVFNTIPSAINHAREEGEGELFIIGGSEIYNQTIGISDTLYLTWVEASLEGDAFFPEFDKDEWEITEDRFYGKDDRHAYDMRFCTYQRKRK